MVIVFSEGLAVLNRSQQRQFCLLARTTKLLQFSFLAPHLRCKQTICRCRICVVPRHLIPYPFDDRHVVTNSHAKMVTWRVPLYLLPEFDVAWSSWLFHFHFFLFIFDLITYFDILWTQNHLLSCCVSHQIIFSTIELIYLSYYKNYYEVILFHNIHVNNLCYAIN